MRSAILQSVFAFAIVAFCCGCATDTSQRSEHAASYEVIDLMPAFWDFWSKASELPVSEQQQLVRSMLVDRYPDVYTAEVINLDTEKPFEAALDERYERWLPLISSHIATMREVSAEIAADLPRFESSFKAVFPDMQYDGKVYFLCSLGGFDGATRNVAGKEALLFGVDMIAYVYGEDVDPQPFFHHELFHIYHSQFLNEEAEALYINLWREGLATYVAKSLNPSAEGVNLFGLPLDMPERAQVMLPRLARELRANLDSIAEDTYARFFFGKEKDADLPARSGYYVGYLIAERIGRGKSLRDLAKMRGPALRAAIDSALKDIEVSASVP